MDTLPATTTLDGRRVGLNRHWLSPRKLLTRYFAGLQVPSIVVDGEFNYVLNPRHADFRQLKIGAPVSFSFDPGCNGLRGSRRKRPMATAGAPCLSLIGDCPSLTQTCHSCASAIG